MDLYPLRQKEDWLCPINTLYIVLQFLQICRKDIDNFQILFETPLLFYFVSFQSFHTYHFDCLVTPTSIIRSIHLSRAALWPLVSTATKSLALTGHSTDVNFGISEKSYLVTLTDSQTGRLNVSSFKIICKLSATYKTSTTKFVVSPKI